MEKSKSTVRYFLEKTLKLIYANNRKGWRREIDMTVVKEKIKKAQFPSSQLRALGLKPGWADRIPTKTLNNMVKVTEKYKQALKELAKY